MAKHNDNSFSFSSFAASAKKKIVAGATGIGLPGTATLTTVEIAKAGISIKGGDRRLKKEGGITVEDLTANEFKKIKALREATHGKASSA